MFCPRCGRQVNEGANFCGGCGLPRTEIEKMNAARDARMVTPVVTPAPSVPSVDLNELHSEIEKLEKDLNGSLPVNDYTTDSTADTNTNPQPVSTWQELKNAAREDDAAAGQSDYSYNRPKSPMYDTGRADRATQAKPEPEFIPAGEKNENLSTVDYIWMMLISGIPFVGLFYLIWLGFIQKDNVNRQNYARATLIISVFAMLLAFICAMGIVIAQVAMFY